MLDQEITEEVKAEEEVGAEFHFLFLFTLHYITCYIKFTGHYLHYSTYY